MKLSENELIFERFKKERIKGGLSDGKTCKDIAKKHKISVAKIEKQVKIGKGVEREHTDNDEKAMEIVRDHLWEFPDYYTELMKMERKLKK